MGHFAERHDANWHGDWDRRHAHFDHNRFFVFIDGFWCGLDDGFFPWDYLPYYADDYYPYDYYADSQPSDNTESVDNSVPAADATVEATQEELAQLGYYNGPVDGIFGPTTRDAVANYQIAKQLNVTGSLSPDTMQSLGLSEPASNWTANIGSQWDDGFWGPEPSFSSKAGSKDLKRKESDYMRTKEKIAMKTSQTNNNTEESTYALLVRSEDKKRALLETILCGLVILSALAAILQFADQPVLFGA
jgi:peptidoglycan hydrolase-like protein with peptidoglycan-binding domain